MTSTRPRAEGPTAASHAEGWTPCRCGAVRSYREPGRPWSCGGPNCMEPVGVARGGLATVAAKRVRPRGAGVSNTAGESGTGSASSKPSGSDATARAAERCDVLAEMVRRHTNAIVAREWPFDPQREWRFDVAVPDARIAFELDGGDRTGGHSRGAGYDSECEKFNAATLQGWRVYRVPNRWLRGDRARCLVRAALGMEESHGEA